MAYGTPTDPVGGTVITVAYAVANFLDPIRALRAFTGGADPPGSGYVVTSDSTSATTWKTVQTAITAPVAAALATAGAIFNNSVSLQMKDTGGTARTVAYVDVVNQLWYGNASLATVLTGSNLQWWDGANLKKIWREDNDGAASGLDADLLDGLQGATFVRIDTASTLNNNVALQGKTTGAVNKTLAYVDTVNQAFFGDASIGLILAGSSILYFDGGATRTIWHSNNDGAGSGLDADTVDGVQEAALAKLAGAAFTGNVSTTGTLGVTGAITGSSTVQGTRLISTIATGTAPLTVASTTRVANLNAATAGDADTVQGNAAAAFATAGHTHTSAAKIASGTYTGNGGATRAISGLGFTPKRVDVQHTTGTNDWISFMGHDAVRFTFGFTIGFVAGNSLDADGFTVTLAGGMNASGDSYRWVAIG